MSTYLRASSVWRTHHCPGSLRAVRERKTKTAEEKFGTDLHALLQEVIENKVQLEQVDRPARAWLERCLKFLGNAPAMAEHELFLIGPRGEAILRGTVDVFVHTTPELIELYDWKFYREPLEEAESQWQMLSYLAAALQEHRQAQLARGVIYLPVLDMTYRLELERELLEETVRQLYDIWREAQTPEARLNPGAWCGRCSALAGCPAAQDALFELARQTNLERLRGHEALPTVGLMREAFYEEFELWSPARFRGALRYLPFLPALVAAMKQKLRSDLTEDPTKHPEWELRAKKLPATGELEALRAVTGGVLTSGEFDSCCTVSVAKLRRLLTEKIGKPEADELLAGHYTQEETTELRRRFK